MSKRVELTLPDDVWDRVELARGDVPRALWIRRAIAARLVPSARYAEPHDPRPVEIVESDDPRAEGHRLSDEPLLVSPVNSKPAALKRGSEIVMRFKCPDAFCERRFGSASAVCPLHGRKAVEG